MKHPDYKIPEVTVESVLKHVSVAEGLEKYEAIKEWEYIEG